MSRTYKDRPSRVRFPEHKIDDKYENFQYELETPFINWKGQLQTHSIYSTKRAGYLPKKKRRADTEWHWQSTPSWWTNLYMNRPQRQASNQYMRQLSLDIDLDEVDPPLVGNKPHIYFW